MSVRVHIIPGQHHKHLQRFHLQTKNDFYLNKNKKSICKPPLLHIIYFFLSQSTGN